MPKLMGIAAELIYPIGDDFDADFTAARPVEFAKEDSLPAADRKLAIFDHRALRWTDQRRLDVRIRIVFRVMVIAFMRDQPVERSFNVTGYGRVVCFVDGH